MDVDYINSHNSRMGGKMKKTINCPTEEQEQAAIFQWAALMQGQYPELRLLHHIPNGGQRNKATAARLKAQGVKPGVPDIFLPVSRRGYHGLYIELKRKKGGQLSEHQKEWLDALFSEGYLAVRCDGADEAIGIIADYLKIRR